MPCLYIFLANVQCTIVIMVLNHIIEILSDTYKWFSCYQPFPPIRRFPFCVLGHLVSGSHFRRPCDFQTNMHNSENHGTQLDCNIYYILQNTICLHQCPSSVYLVLDQCVTGTILWCSLTTYIRENYAHYRYGCSHDI